jgi:hypothetical protein
MLNLRVSVRSFAFSFYVYRAASTLYADVQYAVYQQYYAQLTSAGSGGGANSGNTAAAKKLELSPRLLGLARTLDKLALMGCLVFSELPAHNTNNKVCSCCLFLSLYCACYAPFSKSTHITPSLAIKKILFSLLFTGCVIRYP